MRQSKYLSDPSTPSVSFARRLFYWAIPAALLYYAGDAVFVLYSLKAAVEQRDTVRLDWLVDFPKVRDGLKEDFKAQMLADLKSKPQTEDVSDGVAHAAAFFFGPMIVGSLIDQYVTPSGFVEIMKGDSPAAEKENAMNDRMKRLLKTDKFEWAGFVSPTVFALTDGEINLFFGFADFGWKLRRVQMPMDTFSNRQVSTAR